MDAVDPRAEEVREQLERILASPGFEATEKLRAFLSFVVEETLEGRGDQLKGYTIASEIFGRDESFDSTKDPVVRTQAAKLRRALELYYLTEGSADPLVISIPKGRYLPLFTGRGTGAAPQRKPEAGASPLPPTPPSPDIAVLPLGNLTGHAEYASFANGLALEFSAELSRYEELSVIPCHGAEVPADALRKMTDMGRECGASFVLGGGMRVGEDELKLDVQLIESREGRRIWGGSYKLVRDPEHLIRAQEEIAREVVAAVGGEYGTIARRISQESRRKPPEQLSTYEAMLRFYDFLIDVDPARAPDCLRSIRQAVEREPQYGPAWSALAILHGQEILFDLGSPAESLGRVLEFAQRGAVLTPHSPVAHLVLASVHLLRDDLGSARRDLERVLELGPRSSMQKGSLGHMLVRLGDFEAGLPLLDEAIELNPYHPRWFHHGLFLDHYRKGQYEEAFEEGLVAGTQIFFWSPLLAAAALARAGRVGEAAPYVEQLLQAEPGFTERGRHLMRLMLKSKPLVEDLVVGLRAAGVDVDD